jgi:ABC-type Zn uptake system ZnuABC Zn-binding protein ZnuA
MKAGTVFLFLCFIGACGTAHAAPAAESGGGTRIKVVVTLPILKDFTERVGGDRVEVKSLLSGLESQHTYTPKPSDILEIRKADLLVKIGLGLDVWTDHLVANAQNPNLTVVVTSEGIPVIADAEEERAKGDSNSKARNRGNPHIWLDPENAKLMIGRITEALAGMDPEGRSDYEGRRSAYFVRLDAMETRLAGRVSRLKNREIITHHDAWPYFARRFGFKIRDTIITQVGTEPSAKHIAELIRIIRDEHVKVVVSEPQLSPRLPQLLKEETGVRVVVLSPIPGVLKNAEDYYSMIEYDVESLVSALED